MGDGAARARPARVGPGPIRGSSSAGGSFDVPGPALSVGVLAGNLARTRSTPAVSTAPAPAAVLPATGPFPAPPGPSRRSTADDLTRLREASWPIGDDHDVVAGQPPGESRVEFKAAPAWGRPRPRPRPPRLPSSPRRGRARGSPRPPRTARLRPGAGRRPSSASPP
jgi:hypothetical protein